MSPRQSRVARQEQVARDLARLLDEHGVTRAELAAQLGASPQHAGEWCDPEAARSLRFADAMGIQNADLRVALAQMLAGPAYSVSPLPAASDDSDGHAVGQFAEHAVAVLSAINDGAATPPERWRALRDEHPQAMRAGVSTGGLLERLAAVPAPSRKLRRAV